MYYTCYSFNGNQIQCCTYIIWIKISQTDLIMEMCFNVPVQLELLVDYLQYTHIIYAKTIPTVHGFCKFDRVAFFMTRIIIMNNI